MDIKISSTDRSITEEELIGLYGSNQWSAAMKPGTLKRALLSSDRLVTARIEGILVGLGNAISDGHLVVYYPHLLVHPDQQGQGIGKAVMQELQRPYTDFHQQMLTADQMAVGFYEKMGFSRAGKTEPMWIYAGNDH